MEQAAHNARSGRAVRFGHFEVDLGTGELRKNGFKINLQEQPFQVLSLLLAHPGKLVTRDELQKQIWPADTFIDFDLGLNTAIKKTREALGDSAKNPRFVETLPKRGYRFIAVVEVHGNGAGEFTATHGPAGSNGKHQDSVATSSDTAPMTTALPRIAGAPNKNIWSLRHRIWVASAVVVAAVAVLAFRQFRPTVRHDDAVTFSLKGQSYLSDAYDMPDRNERAIEAFREAVRLDRYYARAYAGLGEAYFRKFAATHQNQWAEKAETACRKSQELDGSLASAFDCAGTIRAGRGQYDEAIADFSQAIKMEPENAAGFNGRANAYQGRNRNNDLRAAETDYLRALELAPDNWRGHTSLASFYHDLGRDCDAVTQFKKAVELRPDNSEPMARLGALYIEMGQYAQAIALLEQALRLSPSFAAYENLGTAYLDRHDFAKAVENFKTALVQKTAEKDPDDYQGHGNLARAYLWANQQTLARQEYERAIELAQQQLRVNAKDPDANLSLAIYYAMLGQRTDSRNQLDLALALEPKSPETKFWAMVVELRLGNKEKALAWLPDALKYSPPEVLAVPELDSLHRDPVFQRELSNVASRIVSSCDMKSK